MYTANKFASSLKPRMNEIAAIKATIMNDGVMKDEMI